MSEVLTTGEAARLCGVHFRTVLRWIQRGLLHAYKLPGRGDHRVAASELRRFMRENGIPEHDTQLPRRVLIADDEPAMARAIARVLKAAGYETLIAANGFEAGSLLYTFKPGVITLDLHMPNIDGIEVLRFLKKAYLPAPLKIVAISADDDGLQAAQTLGAHALVRKPFDNAALLAAVESLYTSGPPAAGAHDRNRW